tara:strand:- start:308 stop:589 length:282 start_codon:yes stop_codon:yes gene_type:complete
MPHKFKNWETTFEELNLGDTFLDIDTRDDCEDLDKVYTIWLKRDLNTAYCIWCTEGTRGAFYMTADRKVLNLTGASKEIIEWWKVPIPTDEIS